MRYSFLYLTSALSSCMISVFHINAPGSPYLSFGHALYTTTVHSYYKHGIIPLRVYASIIYVITITLRPSAAIITAVVIALGICFGHYRCSLRKQRGRSHDSTHQEFTWLVPIPRTNPSSFHPLTYRDILQRHLFAYQPFSLRDYEAWVSCRPSLRSCLRVNIAFATPSCSTWCTDVTIPTVPFNWKFPHTHLATSQSQNAYFYMCF